MWSLAANGRGLIAVQMYIKPSCAALGKPQTLLVWQRAGQAMTGGLLSAW